ncbi:PH domain-containing protein [Mesobacillus subterraneus]|uniref:PH domain-containing protein n=1 Tax=Mesobacillus subterraneus TaxID=285983 RepID=A0A3R9E6E7_9BACI|nr:PH domain-containing protein [Mesobacillus subterraneus]RSD25071.1 PH domain-containing protein [Mesobacillus subterraneus]
MERDFHFSKVRIALLFTVMLVLTLGSTLGFLAMLAEPEENGTGLVLFGVLILIFVWVLFFLGKTFFQKEANVTVSDKGLTVRGTAGPGFIPWEDIEGLLSYEVQNNATLGIILKDEEKYINAMSKGGQRLVGMNVKMGYPAFNIGMSNIKKKTELIDLLLEMNVPFFIEADEKEQIDQAKDM